jgi:hypothetical protein
LGQTAVRLAQAVVGERIELRLAAVSAELAFDDLLDGSIQRIRPGLTTWITYSAHTT